MNFASDNASPAAPEILAALLAENTGAGYTPPYGAENLMDEVRDKIRTVFEAPNASVHLVATGTAANCLILSTFTQPWQKIFCHKHAHIETDECAAPEFFTGGSKLHILDGADGRIDANIFACAAETTAPHGVHNAQLGCLSLTSVNELGGVYSLPQLRDLCDIAARFDMPVHLDGARFANAMVALGCSAAEMSWKCGIDAVSFGATKNGCLGVEAVIFFDPAKAWEFELRRKRAGHLFSKHRFLSAQMLAYLTDDLWLRLAGQANAAAARLAVGMAAAGAVLHHGCEANMVFAGWSSAGHERARAAGAAYYPHPTPEGLDGLESARLICNWATTDEEVDGFVSTIND